VPKGGSPSTNCFKRSLIVGVRVARAEPIHRQAMRLNSYLVTCSHCTKALLHPPFFRLYGAAQLSNFVPYRSGPLRATLRNGRVTEHGFAFYLPTF
jgi:hypothetical protein